MARSNIENAIKIAYSNSRAVEIKMSPHLLCNRYRYVLSKFLFRCLRKPPYLPFDDNYRQTFSIELKTIFEKRVAIISTMRTRKRKKGKKCPKNIVGPGAIKFGAIVPSRVSPFMPLVNQASPILAPIKVFCPKDHQVKTSCSFFFCEVIFFLSLQKYSTISHDKSRKEMHRVPFSTCISFKKFTLQKKSNHVLLNLIISELIPSQLGVASTGFDPLRRDVLKGNIGEHGRREEPSRVSFGLTVKQ